MGSQPGQRGLLRSFYTLIADSSGWTLGEPCTVLSSGCNSAPLQENLTPASASPGVEVLGLGSAPLTLRTGASCFSCSALVHRTASGLYICALPYGSH